MYQILSKSRFALFVFVLPLISFASTPVTIKPMIQLSPKVRMLEQQTPTATATQDSLSLPYLEFPRLMTAKQLQQAARVLGTSDGKHYLTDDELLFISGKQRQFSWGIFHLSQTYTRDEQQVMVLKQVAWAELKLSNKQMSGLQVTKQLQEILVDDIALPVLKDDRAPLHLYPQSAPPQSVVTILGGIEDAQYAAHNQVVVIDRGKRDELVQGHVFELYQKGSQVLLADRRSQMVEQVLDGGVQFPDFRVGRLMVIRPYEHFSLALITESRQPIGRDTLVKAVVITK